MTARLSHIVVTQFGEIDGAVRYEAGGLDLLDLPFDRIMNLVWSLVHRNKDEKERQKTTRDLLRPMAGEQVRSDDPEWGAEAQGSSFLASMARGTPKEQVARMNPADEAEG